MLVGHDLLPQSSLAGLRPAALAVGDKELLVAGEAILRGRHLVSPSSAIAIVGGRKPGDVGDVLGQRLFSIQGQIRKRRVSVVLRGQSRGDAIEMFQV